MHSTISGWTRRTDALAAEVLRTLAAWQIPIVQFNGLVADKVGMGWTDLQALYVLANHGPATPSELARRVNLTTGSASRMIDRLERAGFVLSSPRPTRPPPAW